MRYESQRKVFNSVLNGLSPNAPGVASTSWQQLAAVATLAPDIRWLGRIVYDDFASKPKHRYFNDFRAIHAGQVTKLENEGHRGRFGEKCLKYSCIEMCLRVLEVCPPGEFRLWSRSRQCIGAVARLPGEWQSWIIRSVGSLAQVEHW